MCGLVGVLDGHGGVEEAHLRRMADLIIHRGPDDEGYWIGGQGRAGLGFRRLSILDLSPAGHQPMTSAHGRFTCVFNGEIYNFASMRQSLESLGYRFRGHSDTEIILAGFEVWGVPATLARSNGMFALAIWDNEEEELILARDRFGKKPLYLAHCGSSWLFGSELKSFHGHPDFQGRVSRSALAAFFRFGYVPGPHSIFEGVTKLAPGHFLRIKPGDTSPLSMPYWEATALLRAAKDNPFTGSREEGLQALNDLLLDAVGIRMVADVPLGAFLSGGIDSSLIVALMQAQSSRPVKTFTIGFNEQAYNEAESAKAVSQYLGTEHTELYLSPEDALATIPDMARIYDEPFADPSQVPTYLVSRMARQHVTVALSGDGGDELFGGYNRYFHGESIYKKTGWLPKSVRRGIRGAILSVPPANWDSLLKVGSWALPRNVASQINGDRLHKAATLLEAEGLQAMYRTMTSLWPDPLTLVTETQEAASRLDAPPRELSKFSDLEQMMFLDTITYLTDDILVKVDRANMACSLEGRAPLLDWRVADLAWRMPLDWKIRGQEGKQILRDLAYRYIPKPMLDRPKMGFGAPVGAWVRGPLRAWAEELLCPSNLSAEDLPGGPISQVWREHLDGSRDWQYRLWPLLMFLAWRRK
jgi:asparagine synthase (glutamine-hydrolysing)